MKTPSLRITLDQINGSAPSEGVRAAMTQALGIWGNPSSLHAEGRAGAQLIDRARVQVAALIGARSEEILFTSSGTEANALALRGLGQAAFLRQASFDSVRPEQGRRANYAQDERPAHVAVSAIEHLSILQEVRRMEKEGWRVTYVPVDGQGRIDPESLERLLTPETVLVSIQWANPEVGTIQPIAELVRRVKARGILFHTDAVATVGQVPIDVREIPVDALTLAANTFGGPPGVGALFVRKGVRILPLFVGGVQEGGRRAGTENVIGIVGMGQAAEEAHQRLKDSFGSRLIPLRDRLIRGILDRVPEASLNGDPIQRLPGHGSVSFPGVEAESLVLGIDLEGVSVGLGSACTAQAVKASHVLKAMGVKDRNALGAITLTLGPQIGENEIDRVLEILPRVVAGQRHFDPPKAERDLVFENEISRFARDDV